MEEPLFTALTAVPYCLILVDQGASDVMDLCLSPGCALPWRKVSVRGIDFASRHFRNLALLLQEKTFSSLQSASP